MFLAHGEINMKTDDISSLGIVPEEYDSRIMESIDFVSLHSEMNDTERRFVNGLIRYYRPKSLIELGVSYGGGSVNILNAISDSTNAELVSIDKMEYYYRDESFPVGHAVSEAFPDLAENKWSLITGKDVSEVMGYLDKTYDFAVIDTSHAHPIESLNFLCLLPYIRNGAIVILHDVALFLKVERYKRAHFFTGLAPRVLAISMVGSKLYPRSKSSDYVSITEPVNNIIALQITEETRQNIGNCFMSLMLPWEIFPFDDIQNVRNCLKRNYPTDLLDIFDEAVRLNFAWTVSNGRSFSIDRQKTKILDLPENAVFYGAGQNMKKILCLYDAVGIQFNHEIWDINAGKIGRILGHEISYPDFDTRKSEKRTLVITISDKQIANSVSDRFHTLGWNVIRGAEVLFGKGEHEGTFLENA